jgi:hypothetical protein
MEAAFQQDAPPMPLSRKIAEPVDAAAASIERANAWLGSGRHAAAYSDALALLARQPENHAAVEVFVHAAVCAERHDEGAEVLREFRHRINPIGYACAQASMSVLAGDLDTARGCAESLTAMPGANRAYLDMMVAIAEREDNPETILERMRERERQIANFPFAWLPARWEVQGRLGQHDDILRETGRFEQSIPARFLNERRIVRLHRAMANHNALRFEESVALALDLVADLVGTRSWPSCPVPSARLWTRRRQHVVIGETEWIALVRALPMAVHAGTLLGLVREGGFFQCDQDIDLAVLPPATSAMVAEALVATGAFRIRRQALDTGSFRALTHVRTGLAVDVTEYRREGDLFVSTWRHPSGVVLRRAAVPAFSVRLVDHAGVGRRLPLPDAPEEQLRATYGDWETPNPNFDTLVSAPNILEFTGFLRSMAAVRLADAMLSGRNGQAGHLARRLLSKDISPDLMERIADGLA